MPMPRERYQITPLRTFPQTFLKLFLNCYNNNFTHYLRTIRQNTVFLRNVCWELACVLAILECCKYESNSYIDNLTPDFQTPTNHWFYFFDELDPVEIPSR